MYNDGYNIVVNIDISPVVINAMKEKHPEMEWLVMDVTNLSAFDNASFDYALDKGTLDAILVCCICFPH
jgi:ubiquinone/menaquinone biosynthesis C-methylase UbiE